MHFTQDDFFQNQGLAAEIYGKSTIQILIVIFTSSFHGRTFNIKHATGF